MREDAKWRYSQGKVSEQGNMKNFPSQGKTKKKARYAACGAQRADFLA
jgi:hypothetical protein